MIRARIEYLISVQNVNLMLVGWLCFTYHQQRGHLETTPPFSVSCEGREAYEELYLQQRVTNFRYTK